MPAIMFQGTGSDVGKSLLVAGLARAYTRRGLKVMPFKPQNMSNNAAVTIDGGEIGRAQALQARAAGVAPRADMNPVLLKPQSLVGSQIVVQGKVWGQAKARDYQGLKPQLLPYVLDSFERLRAEADLVLVEGAGSAAEVNLRQGDIANMGFACATMTPVVLIGDIDRGGVIASIVGTHTLISDQERDLLKGYIINKFRGDLRLFDSGLEIIHKRTGLRSFGIAPYFAAAHKLPAEDAVALDKRPAAQTDDKPLVVVVKLPHIANFEDFDPLAAEPDIELRYVGLDQALPLHAALVIVPGSKTTIADLMAMRAAGFDHELLTYHRRGGRIIGICGGYQMLGQDISDPDGIEGSIRHAPGLGLLDIQTELAGPKTLTESRGQHVSSGQSVMGYEIHMGKTEGPDCARAYLALSAGADGAVSADGRVAGCYLHGLFSADGFRRHILQILEAQSADLDYQRQVDGTLDALAAHLEQHLDLDGLLEIASQ